MELINAVYALPVGSLLLAVALFGFLPGVMTKLIARVFPREDARRAEMSAEIYAVPRWERPFWVAEQLERAITEGIPARVQRSSPPWMPLEFDAYGMQTVVWYSFSPHRRKVIYLDAVDARPTWRRLLDSVRPSQRFVALDLPGGIQMVAYPKRGGKAFIAYLWNGSGQSPQGDALKSYVVRKGRVRPADLRNGLRRFRDAEGKLPKRAGAESLPTEFVPQLLDSTRAHRASSIVDGSMQTRFDDES